MFALYKHKLIRTVNKNIKILNKLKLKKYKFIRTKNNQKTYKIPNWKNANFSVPGIPTIK